VITSSHNPKIQRLRALIGRRQEREQAGAFVVEGVRLTEEALQAGWTPELALFSETPSPRGRELLDQFRQRGADVEEVEPGLLKRTSGTENSQGIAAIFALRNLPLPENPDFVLIADAVHDPGNLGTLLRSASAAGVQAIFLSPGTTDPFAPKVLRAGMGAHFRLPLASLTWPEIIAYCKKEQEISSLSVLLAEAKHGIPCWSLDLTRPLALLVGSEAEGASPQARSFADQWISIPMPGRSESLNDAMAASILLFEVVRQRSLSKT
jgi:TrmH family RNA methyltransferase